MADNDIKQRVLDMATSSASSQVDDDYTTLSKKQEVYTFDGKCVQCKDIIKNGHATICTAEDCKAVLHPGCFGTHMVTVHAVPSLPIIVKRNTDDETSTYIIKGEVSEKKTVNLGRENLHVVGNEIESVVPSIEIKSVDEKTSPGKGPISKAESTEAPTQREIRAARTKKRLEGKKVKKDPKPEEKQETEPEPEKKADDTSTPTEDSV